MPEPEDLVTPVHSVPVTTVRVTWLDVAGTPDHPWAVTYQFTNPVDLTLARQVRRTPLTAPLAPILLSEEYLAHLAAPYDHPERMGVAYLARGLQRPGTPKCVEAWAALEDGAWLYALLPWWDAWLIRQDWPVQVEAGQELHAAGRLREVGAHTWPPLCPLDEPRPVEPGASALITRTSVPPPAHGFPPPQPTARHARPHARTA
ncbi:hypothetical protein [Streptomyces sp. NPDC006355]|uniref:hypothetical protein n=1 Tax=Streptomyces sp. NPDC006355 TaxID=3156758 RepID=UPI0033A72024